MASAAAMQFSQQLSAALLPAAQFSGVEIAAVSPLSVWFALVLLLNGAGVPSPTYNEIWKVVAGNSGFAATAGGPAAQLAALNTQVAALRGALARQSSGGTVLTIADGVWTNGVALNPEYEKSMKALFNAEVASVPNATPINQWAERVTNGLIPQVVSPSLNFNMVLTNALYFKSTWEYPFDKSRTRAYAFTTSEKEGGKKFDVQMMTRLFNPRELRGTQPVSFSSAPGKYEAIRLPYKGSPGLSAVFVLPSSDAFATVADAAKQISVQMALDSKAWAPLSEPLALSLPAFRAEVKQLRLKEVLQALGIQAAFDKADFSKASSSPLVLSNVLHSAVVQVDESGTEAAAATAAITLKSAMGATPPKSLVFNRPFLFFLMDSTTQTVLFQGSITDPRGGGGS